MMRASPILIVDDSPTHVLACKVILETQYSEIKVAYSGAEARDLMNLQRFDCILLDLRLPDDNGFDLLTTIQAHARRAAVIVITSNASMASATQALRQGAYDYLVKPFSPDRLLTTIGNALSTASLEQEVQVLRHGVENGNFEEFIGRSPAMLKVFAIIEAAAASTASVFITGEAGSGKELAAQALHRRGPRAAMEFVAVNCSAIPADQLEGAIFGHVRGAFAGALQDQEGAAARANGGTLFLDELGEMDPQLQTKLLSFSQTGFYQRVGDPRPRRADIRLIAATNRDPARAISEGRLREDLYYRLAVVPMRMPPLRDRGTDILLIATAMLARYAAEDSKDFKGFSKDAEALLLARDWPGNVRQLQNLVRNIVVLHNGLEVTADMIPAMPRPTIAASPDLPAHPEEIEPLAVTERRHIENAITVCSGNLQQAARRLGISPSTIYRKQELWSAKPKQTGH